MSKSISFHVRLAAGLAVLWSALAGVNSVQAACSYELSPASRTHGYGAVTATVAVATSSTCAWTVDNNSAWITILSGASGTGSGTITYAVAGNPNPATRSGTLRVGTELFTITQAGVACTYTISPAEHDKCFNTTTGTVQVTTQSPCSWTVVNPHDWIQINAGGGGTGAGKVYFTVLANNATTSRTGIVTIANQPFTIRQAPYPLACAADKTVSCSSPWNFDAPALLDPGVRLEVVGTTTNQVACGTFQAIRTWKATDRCENVAFCTQTVSGTNPPVTVACPPNRTVDCATAWSFDEPIVTSPCGHALTIASTVTNNVCGPAYTATRTWTINDGCTNLVCSQTITVAAAPLSLACGPDRTVACGGSLTFDPPILAGSCNPTVSILSTITNEACGPFLSVTRTWQATDGCSTNTCSQTLRIAPEPLRVTCAPDRTLACGDPVAFDAPTVTGSCNPVTRILSTTTNDACGPFLSVTRSWEVTDGCTTNTCSQTVSAPRIPLVVLCPPDATVRCDEAWAFGEPQAASPCTTTVRLVSTSTNAGCGRAYTASRTWEITDGCATNLCTQTIQVVVPPPILVCPPDLRVTTTNGLMHCPKTLTEFRLNGGIATNGSSCDTFLRYRCSESSYMPNANGCGGLITRTFTLTDSCSNSVSCIQTIFVLGSNTTATVTINQNDGCDVPPLPVQLANPITLRATVNASVNAPSYLTTTFSNVPPGYVVTNGGAYLGWCMDYAGEILPNKAYNALLYRTVDALPAHLPQANWDRINYILNHKQGTAIDIQNAIWHFIGGPVPATDTVFYPPTATASNLIADALSNGAGFIPAPGQVYGVIMDIGFNPQTGRTNQLNIIEGACTPGDACMGGNVTLCALTHGTGPFTYEWLRNAEPIPGATNQCLLVTNLLPAEAGQYCVRVTGPCSTTLACLALPPCRPGAPAPRVEELQFIPAAGAELRIHGKPNRTYRILCSERSGAEWMFIGYSTTDANGIGEFMDESALEAHCRLYKLEDPTGR
ncbi:MAG: hypothetical protein RJA22_1726 [Verrucomicrobiota bacterium]